MSDNKKKKERGGFFGKKNGAGKKGGGAKLSEEEKNALLEAAKMVSGHCKKSNGYCFECPLAKHTQMCTITPDKWIVRA